MDTFGPILVWGAGAIGMPLAALLRHAGRDATAVRTRPGVAGGLQQISVELPDSLIETAVPTLPLEELASTAGLVVVTAKAFANAAIASALASRAVSGPIVVLQNGLNVESPFLELDQPLYRCVLYFTSQPASPQHFVARPVSPSPIGVVRGSAAELAQIIETLQVPGFPFRSEAQIQREVWKKTIINTVFNSVCPLLEIDNGIFMRDETVAALARAIVRECLTLTTRLGLDLGEVELMEQLLRISTASSGQLISTLQDLRLGRPIEIAAFNGAIVALGAAQEPPITLPQVALLGSLIETRAALLLSNPA